MLKEKQIEDQILSHLKFKGIFAFKVKSVGTFDPKTKGFRRPSVWYKKGVSDILGIYKGKFFALEVKSLKGRLNPNQVIFQNDVLANGGLAFVARSIEDVDYQFKLEDQKCL